MHLRPREANTSDIAEITLMTPGDILFLYTDGVYDGCDDEERRKLESVIRDHLSQSAKEICDALLEHAMRNDDHLREIGEHDRIDDKTVLIIKRN
jgi:serine phosphatase RsbU (regulator of sigma subunit)